MVLQVADSNQETPPLVELAAGIDALYLSGRADLPYWFVNALQRAREEAEVSGQHTPIWIGHEQFVVAERGFGMYRFCLVHPHAQIGVSDSGNLPAFRIQFRSEFLHGAGVEVAIAWLREQLESVCGPVSLMVSRIDLHADWHGLTVTGEDRHRFVCRAKAWTFFEENGSLTGIQFGRRKSKTISARIYDKTVELGHRSAGFWEDVWGDRLVKGERVMRVEFELCRGVLTQFGVETPDEVLAATGALWDYVTRQWLTLRTPTGDETKSRWPIAPEWQQIQRARISGDGQGVERMYEGQRRKALRDSAPQLVGYITSFAAQAGTAGIAETCEQLAILLDRYGRETRLGFEERVSRRKEKLLLS